jgi:predicted nucleic acid-binding protein
LRQFFDSSILIAAFWGGHVHHEPSIKLLASASRKDSACGIHTLAEVFAVMTALPLKPLIPPEQGLLFVGEIRQRLALVSLDPEEYFATIRNAAEQGITGGRVYDALLLRCAAKSKAKTTWNLKHFQLFAPHLSDRIRTP